MEGKQYDAARRPKPPLPGKRPAPLEEVAEPQAMLGQYSGIGCELVLALDVPVLQMVELGGGVHEAGPCRLPQVPRFARADAGVRAAEARAPPEGSWEKKKKEEEASSSLSSSSTGVWVLPEEYTGSSPASTHCLVLHWIHDPWRLFGTNSTLFLREGGARAVRTWKPGLSTSH